MNLLLTGICGFVGSTLAEALLEHADSGAISITGIDNFSRSGSWLNRERLAARGVRVIHGDIRNASDLDALGPFDWVIDAAANPSVLAGVDGKSSSRQLIEHNLGGTINLLEACKAWNAGFILLSTSRVYSIPPLAALEVEIHDRAYRPIFRELAAGASSQAAAPRPLPPIGPLGITESFSTAPPVSLYGSTKITSELLALEYGLTFDFPVWINRCGVLAGARQFGKPDQGIFAFWLHSWREGRPLKYIGFDGLGHQVRDCLHPRDLAPLLLKQIGHAKVGRGSQKSSTAPVSSSADSQSQLAEIHPPAPSPILNLAGGSASAMSLRQLSDWCEHRFPDSPTPSLAGSVLPKSFNGELPPSRPFDLPWVVLDHSLASSTWDWQPATTIEAILEEIATFAEQNPQWIAVSA